MCSVALHLATAADWRAKMRVFSTDQHGELDPGPWTWNKKKQALNWTASCETGGGGGGVGGFSGVGGGGGNMINHMINERINSIDRIVANTDAQALDSSLAPYKMQLGINATRGLGAGMLPEKGREAVEAMGYQEGGKTDMMQDPVTQDVIMFIPTG